MNTQQLESFIQVAEHLNFARASEVLNITQSAVSHQIHSLEEELDTRLFYRTTRTVTLTPEGTIFLEHARNILGQLKTATAKIRHHTNSRTKTLTIGCKSESDLDFLYHILNVCRKRISSFHPHLKILPGRTLLNLFFQGEIDILFGFQEDLPLRNDTVFRELIKIPLYCIFPSGHPLASKSSIDETDLSSESLVICSSHSIPAKAVEFQNRAAQHISPEKVYICENQNGILTLIRAGYGCSILPGGFCRDSSVCYVPVRNTALLSYGILYSKNSSGTVLKTFIDIALDTSEILKKLLPDNGNPHNI